MQFTRMRVWLIAVAVAPLLASGAGAAPMKPKQIDGWAPDRPVTIVVPFSPGGGTDATARAVSRQLSVIWRQTVIVENLPGADGLIGTRRVIDAKPDGHTILLQVPALLVTKYQPHLKGIDPLARLDPITSIAQSPSVIVASSKSGATNIQELVKYCKASAEPCSIGGSDVLSRVAAKRLIAGTGLKNMVYVNYRGTSAAVTDVIGRNLTIAFSGLAAAAAHQKAGTLKIISINGPQRVKAFPDVATSTESGLPGFELLTWFGMFAPAGTPPRITKAIADAIALAGKEISVQQAIQMSGAEPVMAGPVAFSDQIRKEQVTLDDLVRQYPID